MQKSMSVQSPQTVRPESFQKPQNMVEKTKDEIQCRNPTLQKRSGNSERVITHRTALLAVSVLMLLAIPVAGQPQPSRRRLCLKKWNPFKTWGNQLKRLGRSIKKVAAVPFKNIKKCDGCSQRLVSSRIGGIKCPVKSCSRRYCNKCAGKKRYVRSDTKYTNGVPHCLKCYRKAETRILNEEDEQERIQKDEIHVQEGKKEKAEKKERDMKDPNTCGGESHRCSNKVDGMVNTHCHLCQKLFCNECVAKKDKFKQARDFRDGVLWNHFDDLNVYAGACMPCWQKNEKARLLRKKSK